MDAGDTAITFAEKTGATNNSDRSICNGKRKNSSDDLHHQRQAHRE